MSTDTLYHAWRPKYASTSKDSHLAITKTDNYGVGNATRMWAASSDAAKANDVDAGQAGKLTPLSRRSPLEELVVWDANVANCAESALSRLVDAHAPTLRNVVYAPKRTKGGVLVRPKYHRGDRGGKQLFRALQSLQIRLAPPILPSQYGWTAPYLQELTLLVNCDDVKWHVDADDFVAHTHGADVDGDHQAITCWQSAMWLDATQYPTQLHRDCPGLKHITFALMHLPAAEGYVLPWVRLHPPCPVAWNIHRLLLLPILKPDPTATKTSCPFSALNYDIVTVILHFVGRRGWEYVTCFRQPMAPELQGHDATVAVPACEASAVVACTSDISDIVTCPSAPAVGNDDGDGMGEGGAVPYATGRFHDTLRESWPGVPHWDVVGLTAKTMCSQLNARTQRQGRMQQDTHDGGPANTTDTATAAK